ncbi:phosphotransferase [Kribbella qitaiheensis]|uniref:Phosphotransferase n=1 Tax=Kribbella qitaiheensis TaxID=1544730 RepID=A0A7G6X9X2_9ACTN|nr:phosphotransferase [Kribbella qitaiheensis]
MAGGAEEVLAGGNVAASVVRIGATVRKPAIPATAGIEAVLDHLARVGFESAPRTLGRDGRGRHVVEYVPGTLADTLPPFTMSELRRLGKVVRELHEAMASFRPPAEVAWDVVIPDPTGGRLICHNDLAPWNLVIDGDRWVFIDWDGAGPGSAPWDLGYVAHGFVPFRADGDPATDAPRLRALVDGYGLDSEERRAFPALIEAHTRGMYDLLRRGSQTGQEPWARLYAEGHGDHWGPTADYIKAHHKSWIAALQ